MLDTKEYISKEIARKLAKVISIDDKQRFFQNINDKIASKHGHKLHNASS